MDRSSYLSKMKNIQENLLTFLESDKDMNEDFETFHKYLEQQKITEECFKDFLHLLASVSNNHYRSNNFQAKVELILHFYKDALRQSFSSYNLFNIFKENRLNILFLIEEKLVVIDDFFYNHYRQNNFFLPELISYFTKRNAEEEKNIPESFNEKRKIGENDTEICEIIRKDSLENFTSHVSQNQIQLNSSVKPSYYETNSYILNLKYKLPTLIEYAAFYGSIQIFNYLQSNNIQLTPSLWLYAIHSNKMELIHILEEKNVKPEDETYEQVLIESIKCHHNSISKYIKEKYLKEKNANFSQTLGFFNYNYFPESASNESIFIYLVQFDYYNLVNIIFKDFKEEINKTYIFKIKNFSSNLIKYF